MRNDKRKTTEKSTMVNNMSLRKCQQKDNTASTSKSKSSLQ